MSGHAAVAVAIATLIVPYLPRRARWVALVVAALVCVSRLYVGAHLPLDVVGGAALGWAAGSLIHLRWAPRGRPSAQTAAKALREQGLEVTGVTPLAGATPAARPASRPSAPTASSCSPSSSPGNGATRTSSTGSGGCWRGAGPSRAGGAAARLQQVEREAYLGLLAASAGVSTPQVVLAGPYGNGSGLLVQRLIPGGSLEEADPAAVGDATLKAAWEEVARLHQAGIAHGDLGRHSVVVDADGRPWLVDFDHATAVAPEPAPGRPGRVAHQPGRSLRPDRPWPAPPTPWGASRWPPPWPPPPRPPSPAPPARSWATTPPSGTTWPAGSPRRWAWPPAGAAVRRRSSGPSR